MDSQGAEIGCDGWGNEGQGALLKQEGRHPRPRLLARGYRLAPRKNRL